MRKYLLLREAHAKGTPPMRPLFYDYPLDPEAWEVEDQYLFGPELLFAPLDCIPLFLKRCSSLDPEIFR